MKEWIESIEKASVQNWIWLIELILGILVLLLLGLLLRKLIHSFHKYSTKPNSWRFKLDQIIFQPLYIGLWAVGIVYVVDIINIHFGLTIFPTYLKLLRNAFLIGCISWMILRWIKVLRFTLSERSRKIGLDTGTIQAIGKISSFIVITLSILLILQVFGLNIMPLLAFGGIGAAALVFAAKDVIANFFGSFVLHVTRSFIVGETIQIPSQNNLIGTVEEIGWYFTMVRDIEKRPVYLPNSLFSAMQLINLSRMTHRKILETIHIRSEDILKIPRIIEEIKKVISKHDQIDPYLPINVAFQKFANDSLEVLIDIYTLATDYESFLKVKQSVLLEIEKIISSHQAMLTPPTSMVYVRNI